MKIPHIKKNFNYQKDEIPIMPMKKPIIRDEAIPDKSKLWSILVSNGDDARRYNAAFANQSKRKTSILQTICQLCEISENTVRRMCQRAWKSD